MPFQPIALLVRRPLLSVSAVAALADTTSSKITMLCEQGFPLAFDISPRAESPHRCLRISATSLAAWLNSPANVRDEPDGALDAELEMLFPEICWAYEATAVMRTLNCSSQQMTRLIRAGYLEVKRAGRGGRGNSALLTRRSCVEFLKSRRIT